MKFAEQCPKCKSERVVTNTKDSQGNQWVMCLSCYYEWII